MLHIFTSSVSYVLVLIRYCKMPLSSMTIYMVAQKQHRIKKIKHVHKLSFNVYTMTSM